MWNDKASSEWRPLRKNKKRSRKGGEVGGVATRGKMEEGHDIREGERMKGDEVDSSQGLEPVFGIGPLGGKERGGSSCVHKWEERQWPSAHTFSFFFFPSSYDRALQTSHFAKKVGCGTLAQCRLPRNPLHL